MTNSVAAGAQQQWEYCFVSRKTENPFLAELNMLGCKGWELVSVLYYKDMKGVMCWTGFLKRPSTGQAPAAELESTATLRALQGAGKEQASPASAGFDLSDQDFNLASDE